MKRILAGSFLAALSLSVFSACGPGDIDRTQPNKLKKTVLLGEGGDRPEYYFRQTVIDVPSTTTFTFIGEQGTTERVIFDIQEDFLFAYRAYPWLDNADGYVRPGTGPFQGSPVAAYRIESHFDVQRQYNAGTGEQTNVIVENTTDRPWFEREYIRVDWGDNLIADFQFSTAQVAQQASYFVPEEDMMGRVSKDQAVITEDYLDIVTAITAEPVVDQFLTEWYGFPILQCWLYTDIHRDCLGTTIKIRSSFRKVEPSDYIAQPFDDKRFQKFGFFRFERYGYSDEYGVVEPAAIRLSNRFNIWENAADCYDPDADLPYSSCSPDQLKPIVYYLNEDFPAKFKDGAVENGEAWNDVFRDAVLASTGWEESRIDGVNMFVICPNNPVKADDPVECGYSADQAENPNPQIGDLRYSMYYYVPNAQARSPLGYGPSAQDPLTGETIQGNAFYYGAAGLTWAARFRDIIKIDLGLLDLEDIGSGVPVRAALQQARDVNNRARLRNVDMNKVRNEINRNGLREKSAMLKELVSSGELTHDFRAARREALKASGLDEYVINDEIKKAFGVEVTGTSDVDGMYADAASTAKMFDPDFFARAKIREEHLLTPEAGGCILMAEDYFDNGVIRLTEAVRREFYDAVGDTYELKEGKTEQDLIDYLALRAMKDVQLHEIGHTVGLRHNFAGSTDALNFGERFWELKGPGYYMGPGDSRPVPEWNLTGNYVAGSEQALREGLRDNQDASIMDYGQGFKDEPYLGKYDYAAIKYAYGDVVEVFNTPDIDADRAQLLRPGALHYTYIPEAVSNAATYEERIAAMYDRGHVNYRKTVKDDEMYDPSVVEVPYVFCSDEYRNAAANCATWDQGADTFERVAKHIEDYRSYHVFDAFKRERVVFGVSVFDYLSRLYNRRFYQIANQYKQWVNDELIIRADDPCVWYENGQEQSSDNHSFDEQCGLEGFIASANAINFFAEVVGTPDVGCYARLENGCYEADAVNTNGIDGSAVTKIDDDPAFCDTYYPAQPDENNTRTALKIDASSTYIHIEDSTQCGDEAIVIRDSVTDEIISLPEVDLPYGEGRPAITTYSKEEYGYYFYWKPVVMGHWWDKWAAVMALGDPNTRFIGTDASSDTRSYLINFNTLFGDEINDLIGPIVTEDAALYAPALDPETATLTQIPMVNVFTGELTRETNTLPYIDPDQQYTFRLIALMNGAYSGWYTDDVEFGESLRVGRSLRDNTLEVDEELRNDPERYQELTDPVTGDKWYAIRQMRDPTGTDDDQIFSVSFELIKKVKDLYYEGGAAGPGTEFRGDDYTWQPRGDIRMLNIIRSTANTFGYNTDVWAGSVFY